MGLNRAMLSEINPSVHNDLCERWSEDTDQVSVISPAMREKFRTSTPQEAFREYLEYNGIIGYDHQIRKALFDLIQCSEYYLTTTDHEREKWLTELFGLDF